MGLFRTELGKTFDDLRIGEKARFTREITRQDVLHYMGLSGDLNPLYGDSAYAGRTKYEHPIVPANMLAGFAMGAVATVLPGMGSLTHAHTYELLRPPVVGDTITAEMEITAMEPEKRQVVIGYHLQDQTGRSVLTGQMRVEPPQHPHPILQHAYDNF
jgi:3-hydroxybutyryl-CoA dehydratase